MYEDWPRELAGYYEVAAALRAGEGCSRHSLRPTLGFFTCPIGVDRASHSAWTRWVKGIGYFPCSKRSIDAR